MRVGRDASRETKGRGATAAQAVCTGEVPRLKIGSRARAECTRNMELMVVTPDVSKLSGWLKADSCRAEKGGINPIYAPGSVYARKGQRRHRRCYVHGQGSTIEIGRQQRGRQRRKRCAGEGPTKDGERTENMLRMVVTLEVSKLSGWLNDDAICRDSKGRHTV